MSMTRNKEPFLIALDLDGTLLTSDKDISIKNRNVLNYLESNGNFIVLASGRAYRSVKSYHDYIGLKKSPIVCYNGHCVYNEHDSTFEPVCSYLNFETCKKIYTELKAQNLITSVMCENFTTIYNDFEDYFLFAFYDKQNMTVKKGRLDEILDQNVFTFVIRFEDQNNVEKIKEIVNKYSDVKVRFWSGGFYCELYADGLSKANAISILAKRYNIKEDNIICFGDADNDIEMLSSFKNTFVMINGNPQLKKVAHNITSKSNDEDGVAVELMRLFDIQNL